MPDVDNLEEQEMELEPDDDLEPEEKKPKKKGFLLGPSILKMLKIVGIALVGLILMTIVAIVVNNASKSDMGTVQKGYDIPLERKPPTMPWPMEEIIVNTADEEGSHIVKATIVLAHEQEDQKTQTDLNSRKYEIKDKIIGIIGSKKYIELNTTAKQDLIKKEILKKC